MNKEEKGIFEKFGDWYKDFCDKNENRKWLIAVVTIGIIIAVGAALYYGNIVFDYINNYLVNTKVTY